MTTPDELEHQFTLLTAATRYDALRTRDALASAEEDAADRGDHRLVPADPDAEPLRRDEALELLALGEGVARKAGYGRQLSVRSARKAGASWSQIGAALGTSKQAAWESHTRWIDGQAAQPSREGHIGWNADDLAAARAL